MLVVVGGVESVMFVGVGLGNAWVLDSTGGEESAGLVEVGMGSD